MLIQSSTVLAFRSISTLASHCAKNETDEPRRAIILPDPIPRSLRRHSLSVITIRSTSLTIRRYCARSGHSSARSSGHTKPVWASTQTFHQVSRLTNASLPKSALIGISNPRVSMTTSPESPVSEGEIRDSGSEKATKTQGSLVGNGVNPQNRLYRPLTRSPSPYHSTRPRISRSRSRSPYRESRGTKRPRQEDYQDKPSHAQIRRFKARHEEDSSRVRRSSQESYVVSRATNSSFAKASHTERDDRRRPTPRSRGPSKSPEPFRHPRASLQHAYPHGPGQSRGEYSRTNDNGAHEHGEERHRVPYSQSVSDRGKSSVAFNPIKQKAEPNIDQKLHSSKVTPDLESLGPGYV